MEGNSGGNTWYDVTIRRFEISNLKFQIQGRGRSSKGWPNYHDSERLQPKADILKNAQKALNRSLNHKGHGLANAKLSASTLDSVLQDDYIDRSCCLMPLEMRWRKQ
jgi:hypothetical protein